MRNFLLIAINVLFISGVAAQNVKKGMASSGKRTSQQTKGNWKNGGIASLALSQGGTRNWSGGGDRFTLSANAFLNLFANHTKGKCHWDNTIDAAYGLLKSRSFGLIKNDDKLNLNSRWSYELGKKEIRRFRVGTILNFRTQFADGYDYDASERKRISSFLAPGIFTLSPGIEFYTKKGNFNTHVGFASRSILVANRPFELAANYSVNPNREVKIEAGMHAVLNYKKDIVKNVNLRSELDLFSDFLGNDPGNVDVYFTNMLNMQVNKWLAVVYSLDLRYDDDTRIFGFSKNKPDTQLKSIFGIGATVKF